MATLPVPWTDLQGILFDVDGTLTNSDDLHFKAFEALLCETGFNGGEPITRGYFDAHIAGRHNPDIMAELFPDWSEEDRLEFAEKKEAFFRKTAHGLSQGGCAELQPLPGLLDFIQKVKGRDLRTIAVTNAPPANAEVMLAAIGLADFFPEVIYGERCPRAKPFPDPYLIGLQRIGVDPDKALVFEDSPSGVKAGVAANVKVVGLLTSQADHVLLDAGADAVVHDYRDVLQMIDNEAREL